MENINEQGDIEALKRIAELKRWQSNLAKFQNKYTSIIKAPVPNSCMNYIDALFYLYVRNFLERRKELRDQLNNIKVLRIDKLITHSKELFLTRLVEEAEETIWNITIDILTTHKYKNADRKEIQVNTVQEIVNAIFYINAIMDHIIKVMNNEIVPIQTNVSVRDKICSDEYKKKGVCETVACEYYKPWFGPSVCRSIKR